MRAPPYRAPRLSVCWPWFFFLPGSIPGKKGPAAWFSALIAPRYLAFSPAFWRNALGSKGGIYLLAACLCLALLGCLVLHESAPSPRKGKWLLLSFFFLGLGLANHWETQVTSWDTSSTGLPHGGDSSRFFP